MVTIRKDETFDSLMKRFKKQTEDEGVLKDYKEKERFMKKSLKRHQEKRKIERKNRNIKRGLDAKVKSNN